MDFGTGQLKVTPGARPQRLRDRPPPRPRSGLGDRRGRPHDRRGRRALRRAHGDGGARGGGRRARGGRPDRGAREPYAHEVPYSHRSGERIEPLISLQWFMRMDELAGPAIEAVRDGRVRILPETTAASTSTGWRTSGPGASRASSGGATACRSTTAATETYVGDRRRRDGRGLGAQEEDVLDTWFSSALWPFATLGWPEDTPSCGPSTRPTCSPRRGTSCSCGSRA